MVMNPGAFNLGTMAHLPVNLAIPSSVISKLLYDSPPLVEILWKKKWLAEPPEFKERTKIRMFDLPLRDRLVSSV